MSTTTDAISSVPEISDSSNYTKPPHPTPAPTPTRTSSDTAQTEEETDQPHNEPLGSQSFAGDYLQSLASISLRPLPCEETVASSRPCNFEKMSLGVTEEKKWVKKKENWIKGT